MKTDRCPLIARKLQRHVLYEIEIEGWRGDCVLNVPGPKSFESGGASLLFDEEDRLVESDIQIAPTGTKEGVRNWLQRKARSCRFEDFHDHSPDFIDVHLSGCTVDDVGNFLEEYGY